MKKTVFVSTLILTLLDPDPDPNSACGSETLVTDVGFRIFGLT
jgi:hypothetical protein